MILNNFYEILMLVKYPLIGLFFSLIALSFYWMPIFNFFKLKTYNNIQRVHKYEVSRLGGLVIYFYLWILYLFGFVESNLFFNILLSALPIIFISLREDLAHNTSPKIRLFSMIISCLIFFYINPMYFPAIEIPLIGQFISLYPVSIIFFTFCILVSVNGMNLIDGCNGLFGLTALIQLLSITLIAFHYDDIELVRISLLFIMPLLAFLFFNYPYGKIFAGDLGAYFYGFVIALLNIYLFGRHKDLIDWLAILILFYPSMELLFSFTRKIKNQQSPFDADKNHLHSLINRKLSLLFKSTIVSNSTTTIVLFVFWSTPILFYIFAPLTIYSVTSSIMALTILYLLTYILFK
jgi:UDP-GlcNAc:undecaprenyl-phosphate/decaprenyl-phosphate GlcNAc-1-phosphate transferase